MQQTRQFGAGERPQAVIPLEKPRLVEGFAVYREMANPSFFAVPEAANFESSFMRSFQNPICGRYMLLWLEEHLDATEAEAEIEARRFMTAFSKQNEDEGHMRRLGRMVMHDAEIFETLRNVVQGKGEMTSEQLWGYIIDKGAKPH